MVCVRQHKLASGSWWKSNTRKESEQQCQLIFYVDQSILTLLIPLTIDPHGNAREDHKRNAAFHFDHERSNYVIEKDIPRCHFVTSNVQAYSKWLSN